MRRRVLMLLLGTGVVFGYGGAIASASWHMHHRDCGAFSDRRWGHGRFEPAAEVPAAPQPQPQTVVVQAAPAAPAAPPQVFIIMPGANPQVVPAQAAPTPVPSAR